MLLYIVFTARFFMKFRVDSSVLIYKGNVAEEEIELEIRSERLELYSERLTLDIALYQDYLIVLLLDCRFMSL